MEMITKNIAKGEPIINLNDFKRLATEKKSVIQKTKYINKPYIVRPAAFYLSWQLGLMINSQFYYTVKI